MKDPFVGAVFNAPGTPGWVARAHQLAHELGLKSRHAVSPEGNSLVLENANEPWAHKHECIAMVSEKKGLVAMYCARWYGSKTSTPRPDQTQWYATLEAALQAVRDRYNTEEAVWRLGG